MYLPAHFEETRLDVLHALVRSHPLSTLVTLGGDGLIANHIPLYLRAGSGASGSLVGHIARSNPLWKESDLTVAALAIFQGPQTYISPSWYATKKEHGRVVPTWNYAVVHVHGLLRVIEDAAWIATQLHELTNHQEAAFPAPWSVHDAPLDYTARLVEALVGIEIPVTRITGKWKTSQNQPEVNRNSLVQALGNSSDHDARLMASLVGPARD
jgi:transcriptional regulator